MSWRRRSIFFVLLLEDCLTIWRREWLETFFLSLFSPNYLLPLLRRKDHLLHFGDDFSPPWNKIAAFSTNRTKKCQQLLCLSLTLDYYNCFFLKSLLLSKKDKFDYYKIITHLVQKLVFDRKKVPLKLTTILMQLSLVKVSKYLPWPF